jgi:signal transduction histidine kinase
MGNSFSTNNIHLQLNIDNNFIKGYENELLQALLNILNNAKDALKNKDEKKVILISVNTQDNHLIITIHDSANGVPREIISKIYDPYFTTKHQSQGTGIGLYMTKEIIENHMKGNIKVENKKFKIDNEEYFGAMFKITIPIKLEITPPTAKDEV